MCPLGQSVYLRLTAFDIARLGKDQLYAMVEEKVDIDTDHEVLDMEMLPVSFEDECVTYECHITKRRKAA